jgi:2-polyprenyl-3-methyl-5-hydroxy-6-metoxy-1,4-benzoquinol methylase
MPVCIFCGGTHFHSVYTDELMQVVRCVNCGLVRQADCAETLSKLNDDFDSVARYYETRRNFYRSQPELDPKKIRITLDIRRRIEQYIGCNGRALDVGCGNGEFLASLKEAGFDVYGVEPDPLSASFVEEKLGIQVCCSMYQPVLFAPSTFNVITFIQVLEHVENPIEVLSTAYMHLKPGGLLVIDVPSFNNPRVLVYRLIRWKRLVRKDFIVPHCYYYTRHTLSNLVKKVGFHVANVQTGRYSIKLGVNNMAMKIIDKVANTLGIGGITLYATKV